MAGLVCDILEFGLHLQVMGATERLLSRQVHVRKSIVPASMVNRCKENTCSGPGMRERQDFA